MDFCTECRTSLLVDPFDTCPWCSSTIGPFTDTTNFCPACRTDSFAFAGAIRLGPYDGLRRELILRMKSSLGEPLAETVGAMWAERQLDRLRAFGANFVVPVPLHWWRRMRRGYNQSGSLADAVAVRLGVPCIRGGLVRVRRTERQTDMKSTTERRENVRGAFRVSHRFVVRDRTVLLIDDVMTTGSTAHEAARALRTAGAARVVVAVLAHG